MVGKTGGIDTMSEKRISVSITAAVLAGACAFATPVSAADYFTGENIGRAIGAVTGAVIGNQVGHGGGRAAAVAIGTLGGYWIGGEVGRYLSGDDQAGINRSTETALDTGESQSWSNPESGVYSEVSVYDEPRRYASPRLTEAPALDYVNGYYQANSNVNVRGGPGTDYEILHGLSRGERVPVIGKVQGHDWYMIAEGGEGSGFVYAPLLSPAGDALAGNAVRDADTSGQLPRTYAVEESDCRLIHQEVTAPGMSPQSNEFRACRQADGRWVKV